MAALERFLKMEESLPSSILKKTLAFLARSGIGFRRKFRNAFDGLLKAAITTTPPLPKRHRE
jgi:hypothetical protein